MKPLPILACVLLALAFVPGRCAARPLPLRGLVRAPVEPFPGGGLVPGNTQANLEHRWAGSVHGGRAIASCPWRA